MGDLTGKTALITGAGRGQGRAHAVTLASAGADIVAIDICRNIASCPYPLSTPHDLDETAQLVRDTGRRVFARQVDVRERTALAELVTDVKSTFAPIDIVVANAGISALKLDESPDAWHDVLAVNLTGVFNTVDATVPSMIERGEGGAIVLIGSTAALTSGYGWSPCAMAYQAAKHGVVALMRGYAANLGQYNIRVNAVHPSAVDTPMAQSPDVLAYVEQVSKSPGTPSGAHALPIDSLEPEDIANAVHFLVSDRARYITGVNLPIDAGYSN